VLKKVAIDTFIIGIQIGIKGTEENDAIGAQFYQRARRMREKVETARTPQTRKRSGDR